MIAYRSSTEAKTKTLGPARRIEILVYPAVAAVLDGTITLAGQPSTYFGGNYASAEEMNPIGYWALSQSPYTFTFGLLLWIIVFLTIMNFLNDLMLSRISLAITALHVFGVGTWLVGWNSGILWVTAWFTFFRFVVYPRYFC